MVRYVLEKMPAAHRSYSGFRVGEDCVEGQQGPAVCAEWTQPGWTLVDWLLLFPQQEWYLSVSRGTVTVTSTWWPTRTWKVRPWSQMMHRIESSLGASTRAGACTGRAVAVTTRRRKPACPLKPRRGKGLVSGAGRVSLAS